MKRKNLIKKFERENNLIFRKILFILIPIIFILLISKVSALGVTPARNVINFEPNLEKTITLNILNNEHKNFRASVYLRGELSDYVTLDSEDIVFRADEDSKEISYTLNLPAKIDEPGTRKTDIVIREIKSGEEGLVVISSLVSVVSQLYIEVPYPGKYAKANLDILEAEPGKETKFFIQVYNLGEENINIAKAMLYIFDKKGDRIAVVESNEKSIRTQNRVELTANWLADVSPGIYNVTAVVNYDGKTLSIEKSFLVGEFFAKLLDVSVKNFKLGHIAKFDILVENIGDVELKDFYSQIILKDNLNNEIMNEKTESKDIKEFSKKELKMYWDTEDVKKGIYDGKIILSYEGKSIERIVKAEVLDNAINLEIAGITAKVIATRGGGFKVNTLLIIIIVLLVMANLLWFLYFKRRGRK